MNKNIQTGPKIVKGLSVEHINKLKNFKNMKVINQKNQKVVKKPLKTQGVTHQFIPRPDSKYLVNLADNVKRIEFPEKGSFNPGLVKLPNSKDYIMVYRPDEYGFVGCKLDENLNPYSDSYFKFNVTNCADPRIIWTNDNKLLMVYSSTTGVGLNLECIRGSIIMDLNKSDSFINTEHFRISPEELNSRQKNWIPFLFNEEIYLIASICPHIIYKFDLATKKCTKISEEKWFHPWIYPELFLRGNTNPVLMEDGNFLSTFHTATWYGKTCYYDNGCYVFEGKFPFKILRCSNRTYLPAEGAIEPHFRNLGRIACTFPVGMVLENNDLLISYGDNDSVVKIMRVDLNKMLSLTLDIF
jgi:predicted GH43/DUF377 family glycosyl hydrolase